ncbi:ABC transporter ATP-binding protein [Streptomyces sp. NPDC051018]|uniref:ABC transporter ATP-binding protein n=1 Tax=Streptomyces sp. NPDC051018 TaxID=3365639 RepID=UPI003793AAF5
MSDDVRIPRQSAGEEKAAPDALLKVEGLVKHFPIRKGLLRRQTGAVQAVDGLTFDVRPGETLGVVGESGCGKSTMGRLITRLLEPTGGRIAFEGHDITHLGVGGMRPLRRDIQMIFQDPYSSLNPRHTIGTIVSAPFRLQGITPEVGVKKEVQRLLELVGLNPEHYNRYPHEFSGGQRQRIGIARALALKPRLVVADEPVSALDVSIQAQVVNLLDDLQDELGLTYVIIAHDLSVIRHVSDRIAVMYLGKIVELSDRKALYETPMHPYTKALLSAVPVPDPRRRGARSERILLTGDVPSPISPPAGCRFHTRCWKATEICTRREPPLLALRPGRQVACHHPENAPDQAPEETVLESAREAIEVVTAVPKSAVPVAGPTAGGTESVGLEAGAPVAGPPVGGSESVGSEAAVPVAGNPADEAGEAEEVGEATAGGGEPGGSGGSDGGRGGREPGGG